MAVMYADVDESLPKYATEKLDPASAEAQKLWAKHMSIWQSWSRFWAPRLEMGKKCMNFMRRDIFTPQIRTEYRIQDKYPIEPQVMKPLINTLSGQIASLVKSSAITMEDGDPPDNAASPDVLNTVISWQQQRLKLDKKSRQALRRGLVTGYPQWLIYDKVFEMAGLSPDLAATLLPWDSVLCNPDFLDEDGGDISSIIILHRMTEDQLKGKWPERFKKFQEFQNEVKTKPDLMESVMEGMTADERNRVFFELQVAGVMADSNGLYAIAEHLYTATKKVRVWINPEIDDVRTRPDDWDDLRWNAWLQANPDYSMSAEVENPTLMQTVIGAAGFCWYNEPHWFQEQSLEHPSQCILPAVPFIADMVDGIPIGAGEDMLPLIIQKAVCETEGLSEVRKGTRRMNYVREGTLKHPAAYAQEMQKEDGVAIVKKTADVTRDIRTDTRTPNTTFFELSQRLDSQIADTVALNPALAGEAAPRQSAVAKQMEVQAGMMPQSAYVENYNTFSMMNTQLLCYMIPYVMTEQKVIIIDDEFGGKKEPVEVNQTGYDSTGNETVVANDLTSAKYRVVVVPGDDSPTNRMREVQMFSELLAAFGNTILQMEPRFVANLFMTLPNRYAKEAGKFMLETAESSASQAQAAAQAEQELQAQKHADRTELETLKVLTPKVMLKMGPKELQEAPEGFQYFAQYVDAMQRSAQEASKATKENVPEAPEQGEAPFSGILPENETLGGK